MNGPDMTIVDAALARRQQLVREQHVFQLKRMSALMRVMTDLAQQGFVLRGFAAPWMDVGTVYVEPPLDELIDGMQPKRPVAGRSPGHGEAASMWFWIDGVRVQWEIPVEDESYGGTDED